MATNKEFTARRHTGGPRFTGSSFIRYATPEESEWLDEAMLENAFGPGADQGDSHKGYGPTWAFKCSGGLRFTVYARHGKMRFGGFERVGLSEFVNWLSRAV